MLPETSSITISRIGCGELSNCVIGCGLPSSRTSKSSCVSVVTSRPSRSVDGGEDADGVAAAAKDRLLRAGGDDGAGDRRGEQHEDMTMHPEDSLGRRQAPPVYFLCGLCCLCGLLRLLEEHRRMREASWRDRARDHGQRLRETAPVGRDRAAMASTSRSCTGAGARCSAGVPSR